MTGLDEDARVEYKLWLICDSSGAISLTGWSETINNASSAAAIRLDQWPIFPLCADRAKLHHRLAELGLQPAPGFSIDDLDRQWDVYVCHPDITALRERLAADLTRPQTHEPQAAITGD